MEEDRIDVALAIDLLVALDSPRRRPVVAAKNDEGVGVAFLSSFDFPTVTFQSCSSSVECFTIDESPSSSSGTPVTIDTLPLAILSTSAFFDPLVQLFHPVQLSCDRDSLGPFDPLLLLDAGIETALVLLATLLERA